MQTEIQLVNTSKDPSTSFIFEKMAGRAHSTTKGKQKKGNYKRSRTVAYSEDEDEAVDTRSTESSQDADEEGSEHNFEGGDEELSMIASSSKASSPPVEQPKVSPPLKQLRVCSPPSGIRDKQPVITSFFTTKPKEMWKEATKEPEDLNVSDFTVTNFCFY